MAIFFIGVTMARAQHSGWCIWCTRTA